MERSHNRRGYPLSDLGWHIAYHFLIGRDGTVLQLRPETDRTWHTGCGLGETRCKNGYTKINERSFAIVLAGNFNVEEPTDRQLHALSDLVAKLQAKYNIPADHVLPHSAVSPTSCPGKNLLFHFHG